MRTLEGNMEDVALLGDSEVISVRLRRNSRGAIELFFDIDRGAVRVKDRAEDLVEIERRGIRINISAHDFDQFTNRVKELEAEGQRASRGVNFDGLNVGALPLVSAFLDRCHLDVDRGIRRWKKSGIIDCLAPLDRSKIGSGERADEADYILDITCATDVDDFEVGRLGAIDCAQRVCHSGAVEVEVEGNKSDARIADDTVEQVVSRVAEVVGRDSQLVGACGGLDRNDLSLGDGWHIETSDSVTRDGADVVSDVTAVVEIENIAWTNGMAKGDRAGCIWQRDRPLLFGDRSPGQHDRVTSRRCRGIVVGEGAVAGAVDRGNHKSGGEWNGVLNDKRYDRTIDHHRDSVTEVGTFDFSLQRFRDVRQSIVEIPTTVDRQQGVDRIEIGRVATHGDHIGILSGIDRRVS